MSKKIANGFTLLEILAAIVIISVGLVVLLSLLNTNIQNNRTSINHLTAIQLASEALNVVENIRDTNLINGKVWDDQLSLCYNGQACIVGWQSTCFQCLPTKDFICGTEPMELMAGFLVGGDVVYDNSDDSTPGLSSLGSYQHFWPALSPCFSGNQTIFKRTVTIQEINNNHIRPAVTIEWNDGKPHTFEMSTELYNWELQ